MDGGGLRRKGFGPGLFFELGGRGGNGLDGGVGGKLLLDRAGGVLELGPQPADQAAPLFFGPNVIQGDEIGRRDLR